MILVYRKPKLSKSLRWQSGNQSIISNCKVLSSLSEGFLIDPISMNTDIDSFHAVMTGNQFVAQRHYCKFIFVREM